MVDGARTKSKVIVQHATKVSENTTREALIEASFLEARVINLFTNHRATGGGRVWKAETV